jgi:NifB/MoaA-like Fe-S oxidoreductase
MRRLDNRIPSSKVSLSVFSTDAELRAELLRIKQAGETMEVNVKMTEGLV